MQKSIEIRELYLGIIFRISFVLVISRIVKDFHADNTEYVEHKSEKKEEFYDNGYYLQKSWEESL